MKLKNNTEVPTHFGQFNSAISIDTGILLESCAYRKNHTTSRDIQLLLGCSVESDMMKNSTEYTTQSILDLATSIHEVCSPWFSEFTYIPRTELLDMQSLCSTTPIQNTISSSGGWSWRAGRFHLQKSRVKAETSKRFATYVQLC